MNLPFEFHPLAEAELEEAAAYLEAETPGIGLDFLEVVEAALKDISDFPASCPVVRGTVRGKVISRFRYTIYYRIKVDHIRVLAVAHQSRAPFYWLGRS